MNYKKSLLSLATIIALSGVASADTATKYVPLTSATHDGSWILFGVNGFSTGVANPVVETSTSFSENFTALEDTRTDDDQATSGLHVAGGDLGSVEVIDNNDATYTLQVGVNITDVPYEEMEPVRTMYVKFGADAAPSVKFNYKASLEGKVLELLSNGKLYKVAAISQDNTYDNPALAVESVKAAATNAKLTSITDIIDYDLKDNPTEEKYYSKAKHLDADANLSVAAKTAQFYHFDSVSQQWKIWNKNYEGNANDFTKFSVGDAYWGRIDVDDPITSLQNDGAAGQVNGSDGTNIEGSGLVLGTSVAAHDYKYDDNTTKLAPGWNHLAFDDTQPYIRHAATGLIFTSDAADIDITDSTGLFTVTVTLTNDAAGAKAINKAIESAKLHGTLPKSVNIKAFYDTADSRFILISDAKFTIAENTDQITNVTTLTGGNPYGERGYNNVVMDALDSGTTDKKSATSAYGEYALIADLMTGELTGGGAGSVAASLDKVASDGGTNVSAKITLGTVDKDYPSVALTDAEANEPTAALTKANIEALKLFDGTDGTGKVTSFDVDFDGDDDAIIIANTKPFYVKDSTFTRVFEYSKAAADDTNTLTVDGGSATATITPASGAADDTAGADAVATQINDVADTGDTTGVYAENVASKIIAVSTNSSTFDLKDLASGTQGFLINSSSDDDLAKGAIKGVYALDTVAKQALVKYKYTYTGFDDADEDGDGVTVDLSGLGSGNAVSHDVTMLVADANHADKEKEFLDALVAEINKQIMADGINAYAYHNMTIDANNYNSAVLTIEGLEITADGLTDLDGGNGDGGLIEHTVKADNSATDAATLGDLDPIISDLKTNAVYTPNYAEYGPLYTMKTAGYDVKAILKATTDVATQAVKWDSIDLTRKESDWFKNNEFNLFSTNQDSGYWVYLDNNSSATGITISNASFTPTYTYYFDNKDANGNYPTTNIVNGGLFSVTITGLDDETAVAYANVGGENVQLKAAAGSTSYTANFHKYALKSFSESGEPISISVRATNGKGEALKMSSDYAFDYAKPVISDPVKINATTVKFTGDANDTTKFNVYKNYIPELVSSRSSTDAATNRLVGSYTAANGVSSQNLCEKLTYGDVDTLRVVGIDGSGVVGRANISDAKEFTYATMLKGAMVLTHLGGSDDDKAIIGTRYNSSCVQAATQPSQASDNTGVSVKALVDNETAVLAYQEIAGVGSDLSGAWVTTYALNGDKIIQTQNLEEYAGKTIFIEYGGHLYKTAFPATKSDAEATDDTPIDLTNATILPLNNTLAN